MSPLRHRRHSLPRSRSFFEWVIILQLALSSLAGIWLFGGVQLWAVGPLMFLVFIATALYALRPLFFPGISISAWPPATLGLLLFLLYGGAQIPRASASYEASLTVLVMASAVLAFVVWTGLAGESGRWRWLLAALLLSVTVMAWYAIILHTHDSRAVLNLERPVQYGMRASGAYFCPNHFANLLAMTASMALAIAVMPAAGFPLRLLSGYAVLVSLPPLYLSGSRSAWLGLIAGFLVVAALLGLRRGIRRAVLLSAVVVIALAAAGVLAWFLLPLVRERILDALQGNVRINLWRDTLAMIADKPWFGSGPGSFRWVYPHYWHHLAIYIDPQFAHNDYLQLAAEFGIVGALLLLGALGWGLFRFVRLIRYGDADRGDFLIAGFAGACAACAVHACFDYNFHIYGNVHVLAALGGITASVLHAGGHLKTPRLLAGWSRWSALWALLPLLLALLAARAVASYGYALRGDFRRETAHLETAIADYRTAIKIEPRNGSAHRGLGQCLSVQAYWNLDRDTKRTQAEEARAEFQRALEVNPWDTAALFSIGRVYNILGDSNRALESMRELVKRVPHHRDYWLELGLQLRSMQKYEEALEVFERVRTMQNSEQVELNIRFLRRKLAAL